HRFAATVGPIPPSLAADMRGTTWQPGCPVPLSALRLLTFRYWGFDGEVHEGPMVANASVADELVTVFRTLFRARFPLKHVALATRFRPNADPNTRRSVTASFNCRPIVTPAGAGSTWSQHAYGLAVDINPLQNPYVAADGFVRNRFGRPYRDRSQHLPGMIHPGDVVVRAFASVGWGWGGAWSSGKDYMHFSLSGT
ncbi:MAG: M15 family metallopeptidase, partial [Candidatus Velamenicoccus archaeovorus]